MAVKRLPKVHGQQPLPESGERVIVPPARSKFNKPPAPMTEGENERARVAGNKRRTWERSPEGQARTKGYDESQMPVGQRYFIDNYDQPEVTGPRVYDRQLPGMVDHEAAPRPPKWEELSDTQRAHTERALKLHGTSVDRMTSDFGAQIDQAHMRSDRFGGDETYASRFYEKGSAPRDRIDESAHALGISPTIHAQMNAFTSPNTKFSIHRRNGTTTYPNDEAAVHAVRWAQAGHDPQALTNDRTTTRSGNDKAHGYVTNMRKAATAMTQHIAGIEPADWKFGKNEHDAFRGSPKTGPYANSWNDTHPQFTVADVHTGGGGAFPHLGTAKQRTDEAGVVHKHKSDREDALSQVPFSHSVVDYANRQAMQQRNLPSVRRSQATQWGEEQIQRGEAGLRGAPSEVVAYRRSTPQFDPNQGSLLDENLRPTQAALPRAQDQRSDFAKKMGIEF